MYRYKGLGHTASFLSRRASLVPNEFGLAARSTTSSTSSRQVLPPVMVYGTRRCRYGGAGVAPQETNGYTAGNASHQQVDGGPTKFCRRKQLLDLSIRPVHRPKVQYLRHLFVSNPSRSKPGNGRRATTVEESTQDVDLGKLHNKGKSHDKHTGGGGRPASIPSSSSPAVGSSTEKGDPQQETSRTAIRTPRVQSDEHWKPLCTNHPVFGMQQAVTKPHLHHKPLLSTVHPAFGDPIPDEDHPIESFQGAVTVGGFFLAIDPHLSLLKQNDCMNPNAQLTIRDDGGRMSRVRYRCLLESSSGFKLEAIVRFQVGWISPACRFAEMPHVIHLGSGFDVSIPFVMHFTMVNVLDEHGYPTGSTLYFSGTPFLGVSMGFVRLRKGKLVLNLEHEVDVERDSIQFFGKSHKVHLRQIGFVVFKCCSWLFCMLLCVPCLDVWGWCKRMLHNWSPSWLLPVVQWLLPLPSAAAAGDSLVEECECSSAASPWAVPSEIPVD